MNPQPPEYMGSVWATLFVLMIAIYAVKAFCDQSKHITFDKKSCDLFTIGYMEESQSPVIVISQNDAFEDSQLFKDCVDALHNLGFKKTEAKKRAKNIFKQSNTPPTNVQEFLLLALKNL